MDKESVNEPLTDSQKKMFRGALDTLEKLFDEDINVEGATVGKAMEYIPIFVIEALLLASSMQVTQEELYAITDWYIKELNLYAEA